MSEKLPGYKLDAFIPPNIDPNKINTFRGSEYPSHFDFDPKFDNPNREIPDGTKVGNALSFIQDLDHTDQIILVENNLHLVWIEDGVHAMSESRYKANGFHKK